MVVTGEDADYLLHARFEGLRERKRKSERELGRSWSCNCF